MPSLITILTWAYKLTIILHIILFYYQEQDHAIDRADNCRVQSQGSPHGAGFSTSNSFPLPVMFQYSTSMCHRSHHSGLVT